MIGAQKSIPSQGKLPLKYHAIRPVSRTGAQVLSIPTGTSGFHRLNISEPAISRSELQPATRPPPADSPSFSRPKIMTRNEPSTRMIVCTASV